MHICVCAFHWFRLQFRLVGKIRNSFTVSSCWSLELSFDGEQSHVPHQSGFSDHQA